MRIPVPSSVHPLVRLTANLPGGVVITGEFINTEKQWDIELPEGVCEDEVSITADYLKANYEIAGSIVVKDAVECSHKTPEITDAPEERLPEAGPEADETESEDEA